jgi:Kef-type K+ transport system membrane component KefB
MHHFNEVFIQILILLAVSVGVIAVSKKINWPYSIALVLVGLILGIFHVPFMEDAEAYRCSCLFCLGMRRLSCHFRIYVSKVSRF